VSASKIIILKFSAVDWASSDDRRHGPGQQKRRLLQVSRLHQEGYRQEGEEELVGNYSASKDSEAAAYLHDA
jgi:hypothetical protein